VVRKNRKYAPNTETGKGVREMTRYSGGDSVDAGTYWNLRSMNVVDLKKEGVLPGGHDSIYHRLPFFVLFLLMIGLGGAYVLLMPVLIICTTIYMAGVRVFGSLFLQMRKSVSFGWRPAEAYLAGKGKGKGKKETHNERPGKETEDAHTR
jgi:hypothetical protein